MAAVVANCNINISEIKAKMQAKGCQSTEVEAILKAATADDTIWKTIEGFKGKDMSTKEKMIDDMMATGHCARLGDVRPQPVNPNDPRAIENAIFAVETYNALTGLNLVFIRVLGGLEWHFPVGTLYLPLDIATQDAMGTYADRAIVFDSILGPKFLLAYEHPALLRFN